MDNIKMLTELLTLFKGLLGHTRQSITSTI